MNGIDLNVGRLLRELQAEMRTVRDESRLTRKELGNKATSEELLQVLTVLSDRIGSFESHVDARMDQTERSIEERLTRIEALLVHLAPPA
jgi:hypothetical protein